MEEVDAGMQPAAALPPQHQEQAEQNQATTSGSVNRMVGVPERAADGPQKAEEKQQNIPPPTLNSRGLPIRPTEPSCAHYLKKGWCAFGMTCKFNHPELLPHPGSSGLALAAAAQQGGMLVTTHPSSTILQTVQPGQQVVYATPTTQQGSPAFSANLSANVLQAPGTATLQPGGTTVYYLPTTSGGYVPSVVQQQPTYQISDAATGQSFTVVGQPSDAGSGLQTVFTQPSTQVPVYTNTATVAPAQLPTTIYTTQLGGPTQLQGLTADGSQLVQPVVTLRGSAGATHTGVAQQRQFGQLARSFNPSEMQQVQGGDRSGAMQLGNIRNLQEVAGGATVTYLPELDAVPDVGQSFPSFIQQIPAGLHQLPMAGNFMQGAQQQQQVLGNTPVTVMLGGAGEQHVQVDQAQRNSMAGLGLGLQGASAGAALNSARLTAGQGMAGGAGPLGGAGMRGGATGQQLALGRTPGHGQELFAPWPAGTIQRTSAGTADPSRLAGGTTQLVQAMQNFRMSQQQQQQQQQP